jgi:ribose transport system substrate-binding protein
MSGQFALLAALVLTACLSGCAPSSSSQAKRFIFITNGDDPFWDACNAGLVEGAKVHELEKAGYRVVMEKNNGTAQGQIDKLRQYASQSDIAGVAISVIQADNPAIIEEMRNLKKRGVQIITVDGDVNREKFRDARPYYIGTDNIVGGRALGTAAKQLLASRDVKSGGYVQFAGFTDNDNARSRMNGFQEAVGAEYAEIDRMPDGMDRSKARDNVRNAIANHGDKLVALVGIWAYNAPAIAEVVTERNVREKLTVVTFDAQAIALEHMAAGRIDAMVVQNPFDMGQQTVRLLKAMATGDKATVAEMFPKEGQPDGDIYTTGLRVVAPDDKSPLKADMFDAKTVEFMLLPDFRAWLTKYNLTSS